MDLYEAFAHIKPRIEASPLNVPMDDTLLKNAIQVSCEIDLEVTRLREMQSFFHEHGLPTEYKAS